MAKAWKKSPKAYGRKLKAKIKASQLAATGEVLNAIRFVDAALGKRLYPARELSKQDSTVGRKVRLSQGKVFETTCTADSESVRIKIRIKPHFTAARTPAVKNVMTRIGKASALKRKSLLVRVSKKKGIFAKLSLSANPTLLKWAERQDKGEQVLRHKVRLPKEALKEIAMDPGLGEARTPLVDAWMRGLRKGFL